MVGLSRCVRVERLRAEDLSYCGRDGRERDPFAVPGGNTHVSREWGIAITRAVSHNGARES
jgi:hypothetical protein